MRVPAEWLKELVDFSLNPEQLSIRLTMAGLEVEAVEKTDDNDTVLEVNVTPNRPDCLSILGIAREISAMLNQPLRIPEHSIKEDTNECDIKIEITDKDLCRRYAGRVIKGVKVGASPEWLRQRLEKCGMRPVNNVVDATNYVLLELGQPLHAFDMDELKGGMIKVAPAAKDSRITTIDGIERKLPEKALLIWDSSEPVAVAGIMGGLGTEVNDNTKNIFLESAYFLPASIRKTSGTLGLKTESSFRFERGTDIEFPEKALDRAAFLISKLAGGKISKKTNFRSGAYFAPEIKVRIEKVNKVLGTSIPGNEIIEIIQRLGIHVETHPDFFIAVPPSYRTDLRTETDVIEEIARCYGYDRIPVTIPCAGLSKEIKDKRYSRIFTVRETLRNAGFTEAINYSFMDASALDRFRIADNDSRRSAVILKNPLNEGEALLRTFIVPALVQNLVHNISLGSREVKLFETARVFLNKGGLLPCEDHHLGAVYFREKTPGLWKEETPAFYLVKGAVEALLHELKISAFGFERSAEPFLHPGQSGDIIVAGEKTGFIGVLHPDITDMLDLKTARPEVVVMEINVDALVSLTPDTLRYAQLPRYPHIDRDLAIIVDNSLPASSVIAHLKDYPSELIEEASVFDSYKGTNIPEGRKSLAFTIRYRAKDRTLTDSEIEDIHAGLISYVSSRTDGTVRGK